MLKSKTESTTNAQIRSSVPQNSFLSPANIFNGQMNTIDLNVLTAHFLALYGTAAPRHPQPPLERQAQHPFTRHQTALIPRFFICPARYHPSPKPASAFVQPPLIRQTHAQTHASASSPRNSAKLRSPHLQTHGLLKLDLVISYSVALLFDLVSCRVLLSCRWPPT